VSQRGAIRGEWKKLRKEKFVVCTIRQIHESDQVKKNEMGETCGTYGTEERDIYTGLVVET
jgi:hypothetical protein